MNQKHRILFGSSNRGKIGEIQNAAEAYSQIEIVTPIMLLTELGPAPDVAETGNTYAENARLKSQAFSEWSKMAALADDTGLEVKAFDGAPGLYTARYAGENCTPQDNIDKMLREMSGVKDRTARFYCYLSFLDLDGNEITAEGEVLGEIASEQVDVGGFGYDPIFIPAGFTEPLSILKPKMAGLKTHRTIAAENMFQKLMER